MTQKVDQASRTGKHGISLVEEGFYEGVVAQEERSQESAVSSEGRAVDPSHLAGAHQNQNFSQKKAKNPNKKITKSQTHKFSQECALQC